MESEYKGEILPYTKSFRVGIIKEKLENPMTVFVPTPFGVYKQEHNYILEKIVPISEIMDYDEGEIVIVYLYGCIQVEIPSYYHKSVKSPKNIMIPIGDRNFYFKNDKLYQITYGTTTEKYYNFGEIDICKIILSEPKHKNSSFYVLTPNRKLKKYSQNPKKIINANGFKISPPLLTDILSGNLQFGNYKHATYFYTKDALITRLLKIKNGIPEDEEWKVNGEYPAQNEYTYENFYELLRTIESDLPMPKKIMKKLLTQLDTDISQPEDGQSHKMGGDMMDPNLMKIIGSYVGNKQMY